MITRMKQRCVMAGWWFMALTAAQAWQSSMVYSNNSGRLVYESNEEGNRIADFSHAGYHSGTKALPDLPVVHTISPVAGDNTKNIQDAIDHVAAMPLDSNGHRGAILLKKGTYRASKVIYVTASGIVLRGEGQGNTTNDTILVGTGTQQFQELGVIVFQGSKAKAGLKQNITSQYIPVGNRTVQVEDGAVFAVGQDVVIEHPASAEWLNAVNYGNSDGDEEPWAPLTEDLLMKFEGRITAISGNQIKLDTPVYNELNRSLSQATIYTNDLSSLITECGVENIRVVSENTTTNTQNEAHRYDCVHFIFARNCWAERTTAIGFVQGGIRFKASTRCTVIDCAALDPVSKITGGRRYNFRIENDCHDILFKRCTATKARHAFVSNGAAKTSGIVFTQSSASGCFTASESHRRWASGILWDDITFSDPHSSLDLDLGIGYNRGNWGTSHGWTGAGMVGWNVTASTIVLQKPPVGQNYAIACKGTVTENGPNDWDYPIGWVEGTGQANPALPSLYEAQLKERLDYGVGPDAPAKLKVSHYSNTGTRFVALQWTDIALDETQYVIERSTNSGASYAVLATIPSNRISYTDLTVTQGASYSYRVKAKNAIGSSAYGNPVQVSLAQAKAQETKIYQAEYFSAASGTVLKWNGSRWTGQGYADMGDATSWFEIKVDGGRGGTNPVTIRFARPVGATSSCSVSVNGVSNGTVTLDSSTGKSQWKTATINLTLSPGVNTIRMQPVGGSGPDVDYLELAVRPLIAAVGETTPAGTAENAFDENPDSEWRHDSPYGSWIEYTYPTNLTVSAYSITSGSGPQANDPKDWKLLGSKNGGTTWTTLDTRSGITFSGRKQTESFTVTNSGSYSIYRMEVTAVKDAATADSVRLAELAFVLTGLPLVTPNPSTFSLAPCPFSETAITMTATTGFSYYGQVEYYFDETSGNPGGTDSGWTNSPTYTDTGLTNSMSYTYTVKMRNTPGNETPPSAPASATPYKQTTMTWNPLSGSDGLWTTGTNWTGGIAPMTVEQYKKVIFNINTPVECVLATTAVVAQLSMGENGTANGNSLRLTGSANLLCGQKPDGGTVWTAIGYNRSAQMTVQTGAVFSTAAHLIIGNNGTSSSSLTLQGGTAQIATTIQMGNTNNTARGTITIDNGGLLTASGFTFNGTNNLVNLKNGTILLNGDQTNLVRGYIASNWIKAYDGAGTMLMDYNTKNTGKTTLTAMAPGMIFTPDVTGMASTSAINTIVTNGLAPGTITLSTSSTVASNIVISQNPLAGEPIGLGGAVHLLVSVGSNKTVTFNNTTGNGQWMTASNWSGSIRPGTGGTVNFATDKTARITSVVPNIGILKLGDNTVSNGLIIDGGQLTVEGPSWSSFSYNRGSTLRIKNNGSLTFLGIGFVFAGFTNRFAGEKTIVTIESGALTIGGEFRLGSAYGPTNQTTVRVEVNGGTLTAGGLFINANGDCSMDIRKGLVLISGDKTATIIDYINSGRITAYDGTGTLSLNYNESHPGYTALHALPAEEGYDAWASTYVNSIGSEADDYDGDSANNLYEYALNGDPTDTSNNGIHPELMQVEGQLKFRHLKRNDDSGLIYTVVMRTNLLSGGWTTSTGGAVTNAIGGSYDEVTHSLSTNHPEAYIRLTITSP